MAGEQTEVGAYMDALAEELKEVAAAATQLSDRNDDAEEAVEESTTSKADPEQDEDVTYSIMEGLSQRGNTKLVDSRGFTYTKNTKKRVNGDTGTNLWRCSVRNSSMVCLATVSQHGLTFKAGRRQHCHEPKRGAVTKMELHKRIKQCAKRQSNMSGSAIVNEIMAESGPLLSLPRRQKDSMTRLAYRMARKVRNAQHQNEEFPSGGKLPTADKPSDDFKNHHQKGEKRSRISLEPGLSKRLGQLGGIADIPALTQSAETQRDILKCLKELVAVSKHRSDIEEQRLRIEARRLEIEEQRNARREQDRNRDNIVWEVKSESDSDN